MTYYIEVDAAADLHTHVREADQAQEFSAHSADGGADVIAPMPNTKAGLSEPEDVVAYAKTITDGGWIKTVVPIALMSENTTPGHIHRAIRLGVRDFKIYPFGRTTKSEIHGVRKYERLLPLVALAGKEGARVHMHAEHPNPLHSNDLAEVAFLPIAEMFLNTNATLVWEHGTTADCIPFWRQFAKTGRFYLTLTPHHLAFEEDELYGNVSAACKPTFKQGSREHLVQLVTDDYSWVMAGTDSAPHPKGDKFKVGACCNCGA